MRKRIVLLSALAALALAAAGCGGGGSGQAGEPSGSEAAQGGASEGGANENGASEGAAAGEPLKVAFVYVGPVGDAGWTYRHDVGRQDLEEALGDRVETTFVESVPEGPQSERTFEDLARQGNKLIFGTSFGYMDPMMAVAEKFPDVVFEHATGFKTAENLGTYFGAAEEGRYLEGMAAGAASESGKLGYVAAFPIPEVLRGINAYTLGARSVNPDATVRVVWTSTWFGPEIEKQAAESLLDAGVDVVGQHQDTPAPGEAAQAAGAKWTGYNSDMEEFAPEAWLTATQWDWGPHYIDTAEKVLDGSWESSQYYGNMADGLVTLAPFGESVGDDIKTQIEERMAALRDGEFAPFTGPINDQSGEERVAEGEQAPLEDLLSMDYFVEGVDGEIPEQ
ncbi:MAG: BMP family ABC transporter substrate-binding protein [Actinomycetota bacterium]|jgi:basic membrane protein A|nr:BMP family ABC transporter substrate-binding protein [Actinomycetota bacterium]